MSEIILRDICKSYENGFQAVKNFNLEIEKGELVVFVGPSGCGKSTTLRMIAGLEDISDGELWIGDKLVNYLEPKERDLAMVFQSYALYPQMNIYDNIAFSLQVRKVPKKEIDKKVHHVAELLGLENLLKQRPKNLSGGQRQRVGIARAIVSNPSVLLSDEATSALDPETVKSILQLLKDINKKLGITIVMITHQMEVIKEIAQHVAVIEHGKIIEEGSVINLFTNPQTETLKKFVGSVMSSELPAQLSHMNIHPTKEHESDNILISLSFRGDVTNEPIIAQLIKKYNLNVSILYGSIDYIQDISFGRLLIMISGHLEDLTDALTHLNALPITSEVIGYVSRNN